MASVNVRKLTKELQSVGLPIHGVDSNAVISWHDGHPTSQENQQAKIIGAFPSAFPIVLSLPR